MMIIFKAQAVGDFLDGEVGVQKHGLSQLHTLGEVITIRRNAERLFEQVERAGRRQMRALGHFFDGEGMGQVLLDVVFHDQGLGMLSHFLFTQVGKCLNVAVQTKREHLAALGGLVGDEVQNFLKVLLLPEAGKDQGLVQAVIRQQMPDQAALAVEPDLLPGIFWVGIVMMQSARLQQVGVRSAHFRPFLVLTHKTFSLQDILEHIDIRVGAVDDVVRVGIGDARHNGNERGRDRAGIDGASLGAQISVLQLSHVAPFRCSGNRKTE